MKVIDHIAVWCIVASLLLSAFVLWRGKHPKEPAEPLSRDTIVITRIDTITREKPVFYATTVVDTLLVVVRDTVRQQDTLYIGLPREQRAYRDSLYEAWVSGVQPALDSIRVFAPVQCVTVTEQVPVAVRSRWGLGITAGYGASVGASGPVLAPYVGGGVSYNIISW